MASTRDDASSLAPGRTPTRRLPGDEGSRVSVDVEYAHQCAIPSVRCRTEEEIRTSEAVADGLLAGLRHNGVDVTTSVLVDDKKNCSLEIDERCRAVIDRCVGELQVDRVMLESRLREHLAPFSDSLPSGSPLPGRFQRRLDQHGELACSQDVAVWQSLRLGLFEPLIGTWSIGADIESADRAPTACVSILPRRFQKYEVKAYEENLRHHLATVPVREERRMTLEGMHEERKVLLWAIWVDTERPLDELQEFGVHEAAAITSRLPQLAPVLSAIR